jgi:hypothetical protein
VQALVTLMQSSAGGNESFASVKLPEHYTAEHNARQVLALYNQLIAE